MAIVQNTLIGRSSGRVGNAVFTQWKGKNVLKQKPEIVTNPRTALQQQQRSRFTTLMAIGKSLRPILQFGKMAEIEAQMFGLALHFNRCTDVQDTTKPAILPNCC